MATAVPAAGGRRPRPAAREKLITAGMRLVAERGIDAVNSNEIARAAGVGVGTFYGHFEDKRALHRVLVTRGLETIRAALAEAHRATAARPLVEQVRALATAAVDLAEAQPDLVRVGLGRPPGGAGRRGAGLGLSARPLEERLRALQREGLLDPGMDAGTAARAYTEMQTGLLLWWLEEPGGPAREQLVDTLVRLHPALACARRG